MLIQVERSGLTYACPNRRVECHERHNTRMQSDAASRPQDQADFDAQIRFECRVDLLCGAADAQHAGPPSARTRRCRAVRIMPYALSVKDAWSGRIDGQEAVYTQLLLLPDA
jgi:hypothetical protein